MHCLELKILLVFSYKIKFESQVLVEFIVSRVYEIDFGFAVWKHNHYPYECVKLLCALLGLQYCCSSCLLFYFNDRHYFVTSRMI